MPQHQALGRIDEATVSGNVSRDAAVRQLSQSLAYLADSFVIVRERILAKEERRLSRTEFQRLAEVPLEAEWFANLSENTKRAYRHDVSSFMRFVGIERPEDFRRVVRAHVIAWRKTLEKQKLAAVRGKLSALSDLYDYLCEKNAVPDNPVHGVERHKEGANQGKTSAISDEQAAALLEAPPSANSGFAVRINSELAPRHRS